MRKFLLTVICCFVALTVCADDDMMITRDGNFIKVKVLKISSTEVVFIDLKKKRRGELKAPADYIYAILKEKGHNIFFDEEGNQTTSPAIEIKDDENYLFLNNGKLFPVYNLSVNKEELTYQLKDKKKAPYYKSSKAEVFLVRFSDGTTTLINNKYTEKQKRLKQSQQTTQQTQPIALPTNPTATLPVNNATSTTAQTNATPNSNLLASNVVSKTFSPATSLSPQDIETKINAINPYTLYRKGSIAEYAFEKEGKQVKFMGAMSYLHQIVADAKIENGLLVAYIQQAFHNKKNEPMKGISKEAKGYLFPTEIDTAGTFHLTHDISRDFIFLTKRQGYAMLMPSDMKVGDNLKCNTINDDSKNLLGGKIKAKAVYTDFKVVGEEQISTPAGTFNCLKLTGKVSETTGRQTVNYIYNWWIARGVGFVRYEILSDTKKGKEEAPLVIYLNKLDLK